MSDEDTNLGSEIMSALTAAFAEARLHGRQSVDAGNLLSSVSNVRTIGLLGLPSELMLRARATIRSLVAESGGASPTARPQITPAEPKTAADLREAAWYGMLRVRRRLKGPSRSTGAAPIWDNSIHEVLELTFTDARAAGVSCARGVHLVVALLDYHGQSGQDRPITGETHELIRTLREYPSYEANADPYVPLMGLLEMNGVLRDRPLGAARDLALILNWLTKRDRPYGGALLALLETEMARQAVRRSDRIVSTGHALAAIWSLGKQLATSGRTLPDRLSRMKHSRDGVGRKCCT